ncbi:MAG: hypothetical protein JKY42_02365, partial [Flavobacteriales bacterium]|nr:hypothetical protein [Flavobacteriales bacterium]
MGQYLNINIPEPCQEDWNKMTSNEQGAFCGSCQKTVVDFSKMDNQQIRDYFLAKSEQKTCGRFNSKQLNKPISLLIPAISSWKMRLTPISKFATALFLVFGMGLFSCTTKTGNTVGEIRIEQKDFTNHLDYVGIPEVQPITIGDTIIVEDVHSVSDIQTLGEPEIMIDGGVDFSVFEIGETAVEVSNGNQMV